MGEGSDKAEITKEFICSNKKCRKKCEEVWMFTQYGGENRKEEYLKGNSYCQECFEKMEKEL